MKAKLTLAVYLAVVSYIVLAMYHLIDMSEQANGCCAQRTLLQLILSGGTEVTEL